MNLTVNRPRWSKGHCRYSRRLCKFLERMKTIILKYCIRQSITDGVKGVLFANEYMYIPYFFFHVKMILLLFTAPFVQVLLRDFILMILYCCRSTNRRFLLAKEMSFEWKMALFYVLITGKYLFPHYVIFSCSEKRE